MAAVMAHSDEDFLLSLSMCAITAAISHFPALSCLQPSTLLTKKVKEGCPHIFLTSGEKAAACKFLRVNLKLCTPTNSFEVCLFLCLSLAGMDICSRSEWFYLFSSLD